MVGYSQIGRSERLAATHVWPAMMMTMAANAGHLDSVRWGVATTAGSRDWLDQPACARDAAYRPGSPLSAIALRTFPRDRYQTEYSLT